MFYFKNVELLFLLVLIIPLFYFVKKKNFDFGVVFSKRVLDRVKLKNRGISKKTRAILLIFSTIFAIFAIARPQIDNGEIKVKSSFINIVTAIDISHSMFANDIYPNRFEFAKKKFFTTLGLLENVKVALIGFTSQPFLISPLTQDFHSLEFLAKNMKFDYLNLKGTNILNALKSANELFKDEEKKILLLFTDGGDNKDFKDEIAYAKTHNIYVFVYNIATKKGGVIKGKNGVIKDKNGDIVVVKLNEKIKELALKSGGGYMRHSFDKNDVKLLTNAIKSRFKAKEGEISTIKDTKEIFYFPLMLSILLFFLSIFSIPRGVKR